MLSLQQYIHESGISLHSFLVEAQESTKKERVEYARTHPGKNLDAGGKCCWFTSAKDLINELGVDKVKRTFGDNYEDILTRLFELKGDTITYENVPVFNEITSGKVGSFYTHRNDYEVIELLKDNGIKLKEGTCCSQSGSGGVDFETELVADLRSYVNDPQSTRIKYRSIVDKLVSNNNVKAILESIDKSKLSEAISVTGKGNTARNEFGQIINKDTLKINVEYTKRKGIDNKAEDELNDVLKKSGKIIADITISSPKGDVYLSLKDAAAQLSSISLQQPFYGDSSKTNPNSLIANSLADKSVKWNDIKDEKRDTSVAAFKEMCNIFGFDEEVVFNHFQNPKGHIDMKSKVKENNELIAALAHLLIGGNYWYINSNGEVQYIPYEFDEIPFEFKSTGKGYLDNKLISLEGTLNRKGSTELVPCRLQFRSSGGSYQYPYRLFMKMLDNNYIEKLLS